MSSGIAPTPVPSSSSNPTKSDKPSIDIRKLALRIYSAYNQLNTVTCHKLIGMRKNVPWDQYIALVPYSISPPIHPLLVPDLTYNQYKLKLTSIQPNVKTFFDDPMFDTLSTKEKEDIYWMLRLRAGVRPLFSALLMVMKKLISLGYKIIGNLNGETINLTPTEIEIGLVTFTPTEVNLLIVERASGRSVTMIENFTTCPNGENLNTHNVLCYKTNSGTLYVMDIGGLQFGLRGTLNELIGNWEPLTSYISRLSSAVDATVEVDLLKKWQVDKLMKFRLPVCDCQGATVKSVIQDLEAGKKCCDYCGQILDKELMCSACKNGFYCGSDCQKSDWKNHKLSCLKKPKQEQQSGTGDRMG